jgi:hypothetical protein
MRHIGDSISTPSINEDAVFVGSGAMNGQGKFFKLDLNGNLLWEFFPNGAVQSSPALAGNLIYFTTNVADGRIYCLNQTSGEPVWQYTPHPAQYIISSPSISDGKLYVASDNGRLYCFDDGDQPYVTGIAITQAGASRTLMLNEGVAFSFRNREHEVILSCISEDDATLAFNSTLGMVEVSIGVPRNMDSDDNGRYDLVVTLDSTNTSKGWATVTFRIHNESEYGDFLEHISLESYTQPILVRKAEGLAFTHRDRDLDLLLTDVSDIHAVIDIIPSMQGIIINTSEAVRMDTDGDGEEDLTIMVGETDAQNGSASLTISPIQKAGGENDQGESFTPIMLSIIIIIIILTIVLVVRFKGKSGHD